MTQFILEVSIFHAFKFFQGPGNLASRSFAYFMFEILPGTGKLGFSFLLHISV